MRIKNYTSFSEDKIREIIQFVRPNKLPTSNFDVKVTNTCNKYCGVFYEKGGYAKKGIGSDPSRPLIIARVTAKEGGFPIREDNCPRRRVDLYYEKYDESMGIWKVVHSWTDLRISKSYFARRSKENREKGKLHDWEKSTGYIDSLILSREEALVHVLSHEIRHFWETNHLGKRGKVWGARGKSSERDADAYAIKKTREWRRLHSQPQTINWKLIEGSYFQDLGISIESCSLVRSLRESSKTHKIQEYEVEEMKLLLKDQDLD